ncbi:hypothetical protein [Kosakonia radicincitans]
MAEDLPVFDYGFIRAGTGERTGMCGIRCGLIEAIDIENLSRNRLAL